MSDVTSWHASPPGPRTARSHEMSLWCDLDCASASMIKAQNNPKHCLGPGVRTKNRGWVHIGADMVEADQADE